MKRSTAALVIVFALVGGGIDSLYDGISTVTGSEPARSKVAPEVTEALGNASSVSVIVSVASTVAPAYGTARDNLPTLTKAAAASEARVLTAVPASEFALTRRYRAVPGLAGMATAAGVQALARQPDVVNVALNGEVHADLAQAGALINADDVHTLLGMTGLGVVVAVLDTGIDTDHPMLSDDLIFQKCFLDAGTCPGGGTTGPSAEDDNGHGTHVSGIITSSGPPLGVAPDAVIEAFKVLDASGSGTFANVLAAYDDIILNHPEVDIINMSLGAASFAPGACEGLLPAITSAIATTRSMGITTFAAAGNSGDKAGIGYPACINDIVSVGAVYDADLGLKDWSPICIDATTAADQVTCFSQSNASLDLLAPGSVITSTFAGGGLADQSGTSMASPMAAGAAALLLQSGPSLTPADVQARLTQTGVPILDPANGVTTCRVDAFEAVINDGGPICSSGSSSGCSTSNDGFEAGTVGSNVIPCWTVIDQAASFGSWCNQTGITPPQAACLGSLTTVAAPPEGVQAAMTNQGGPGSHVLYRCSTLSTGLVSFELYLNNENGLFHSPPTLDFAVVPNQQFRADLVTLGGISADPFTVSPADVLLTLYGTQPGDPAVSGYTLVAADVSAFIGQTVCLRFAEVDNQFFFHAGVDAINFGPLSTPPPTATPTPTPTPCPDLDGDTICDGADTDIDGDGCTNTAELQTAIGSELTGGRRDPTNPWDYFNPTHDGKIRVDDVLKVVSQFGKDKWLDPPANTIPNPAYNPDTDRSFLGPNPWNLGPPNGLERVDDILAIVRQFGHDCA